MMPGANELRVVRRGGGASAWSLLVVLAILLPLGAEDAKNLCPNGDFEKGGARGPDSWVRPDGLTIFWEKDTLRKGWCIRVDTDVYREEWVERQKEMEQEDPPAARPKTPTKGPGYDTVGGVDGVHVNSDYIPVVADHWYEVQVDFRAGEKGKYEPKVFIKGYAEIQDSSGATRRRQAYKIYKTVEDAPREWRTYTLFFNPTRKTPKVQWIKVNLYAYWRPGTYYFDNVRLYDRGVEDPRGGDGE